MDELDRELRAALRPVQPAAGFAERVMLRVEPKPFLMRRPARRWGQAAVGSWVAGGVAASLLVGLTGGVAVFEHRQRQRLEAERQFTFAMQVTSQALRQTRKQMSRAGFQLTD